jgi:hypothetical protein
MLTAVQLSVAGGDCEPGLRPDMHGAFNGKLGMAADSLHDYRRRMSGTVLGAATIGLMLLASAVASTGAQAQAPAECQKVAQLLQKQQSLLQRVQAFQKKKPTAAVACSAFTELGSNTGSLVAEIEKNGEWCHVPGNLLDTFKGQKGQITAARSNACTAAVQQKKMEAQAKHQQQQQQLQGAGPIGGGGDVLGGPIKVPQGAL